MLPQLNVAHCWELCRLERVALLSWMTPRRKSKTFELSVRLTKDTMEDIVGRMAQMEAAIQSLEGR